MSARTAIIRSRLRRQRIGSSKVGSMRATCASGTGTPSRVATVRSPRPPGVEPLLGHRPGDHRDEVGAVAHLGHGQAGDQRLQRLGDVLRRQPERPGAVLVDHQPDRRRHLVPLQVRVAHVGVRGHRVAHLLGDAADLAGVVADHAELHRMADRRPEVEAVDPHPRARERAVGDRLLQPRLDALARLGVLREDHRLGEGRVRQLRVQPEPEAHAALADVAGGVDHVRVALEQRLGLLDHRASSR